MVFLYPLKPFERIWDRIEKSKGIPKWLKAFLLTILTIAMLAQNFISLLLVKAIVDMAGILLGLSPP